MPLVPIEHPQHDVLSVDGGQRRDPKIDLPPRDGHRDPAVLGQAPFRDVHRRHYLQPDRNRRPVVAMETADLAQHPVDSIANSEEFLRGLEMEIRCSLA